ncbi:MAG: transcriptional modulator of MazE/toxin MazF [Deltaproteobacteria bacterium]
MTAEHSSVVVEDLDSAGLRLASVFRCKLFTLDESLVLGRIGALAAHDRRAVARSLRTAVAR